MRRLGQFPAAISVRNLQRRVPLDLPWLRRFAEAALQACGPHSADRRFALRDIAEIAVALVSDRRSAQIHQQFMQLAGATDVITFEHGDIVISAETAREHAGDQGHAIEEEIALYIVHGLLHLNGYDDRTARDRRRMQSRQNAILQSCLARFTIRQPFPP